jgi:hypothetical protein
VDRSPGAPTHYVYKPPRTSTTRPPGLQFFKKVVGGAITAVTKYFKALCHKAVTAVTASNKLFSGDGGDGKK